MPTRIIIDLPPGMQCGCLASLLGTHGIRIRHCTELGPPHDAAHLINAVKLTKTEQAIIALFLHCDHVPDMAARMGVGVSTIRTHIHHIFEKLEVSSRARAVGRALQLGLLPRDELIMIADHGLQPFPEKIHHLVDSAAR